MNKHQLIPPQVRGKEVNISRQKTLTGVAAAHVAFQQSSQRLLHPQKWKELAGGGSSFEVLDHQLKQVEREVAEGDYLRIDVPGPGPGSGNGFDWVRVELVESSGAHLGIKLRPCANPEEKQEQAAHFFDEASSSTLMIGLENCTLTASYHGRNETPNNKTGHIVENIRNTLVATGAMTGLSELQWDKLLQGLLDGDS